MLRGTGARYTIAYLLTLSQTHTHTHIRIVYEIAHSERAHNSDGKFRYDLLKLLLLQTAAIKNKYTRCIRIKW